MKNPGRSLTARQTRFVHEYLVDLNATDTAIRAGYSPKTAKSQASRLLTFVNVKVVIEQRRREIEKRLEINREAVAQELITAIEIGRKRGDAMAIVTAYAELNKMMGYYDKKH